MKFVKRAALIVVALTVLPATILVVIAAQGRLKSDEIEPLRRLPVFGSILPAAEGSSDFPREPETGSTISGTDHSGMSELDGEPNLEIPVDRAISLTDLERLGQAAVAERRSYERKRRELREREQRLTRLEDDLAAREREIDSRFESLTVREDDLTRQDAALEQKGVLIDKEIEKSLKDTAKIVGEMDADQAAETLAGLGIERAAMILRYVDSSAVADIWSAEFWVNAQEARKALVEQYAKTIKPDESR